MFQFSNQFNGTRKNSPVKIYWKKSFKNHVESKIK